MWKNFGLTQITAFIKTADIYILKNGHFYSTFAARKRNLCTLLSSSGNNKHYCQTQPFKRSGMRHSFVSLFLEQGRVIKMQRKFRRGGMWGDMRAVGWTEMDCLNNVFVWDVSVELDRNQEMVFRLRAIQSEKGQISFSYSFLTSLFRFRFIARWTFFSQYFSFPLSVSFHHCSILIHPSTTHTV
jgi:hypothetical protein